ncbi:MAG: DUF1343 domain-containing protein [Armatimonadota bacterium]|nr:DUF1343 domain-containing protein [Armatimonadota bacterium]MDR7401364.1 DUF1343 domain-containing protein [Armatimonadota bacterium]MDR7404592.1 DUF1343 domain-containing protein [Armatimonadota bacterium]MDR7438225.1 DUF1343 domain-containing protein [Armatimonadota bacterium]MDR7506102.1 DUF1343 domain-containing protein [Armatimonadota bacterium]
MPTPFRPGIRHCAIVLLAVFAAASPAAPSAAPRVAPGVDVLLASYGNLLAGKRVGLITHRAAVGADGWPTAMLLALDPRIRVVSLFAPEHGLTGTVPAGVPVPGGTLGGVPVYSLYGTSRRPTPEMLADLDALVFDLQDVGARAYTYISSLALAMQAAADRGLLFVVLDRPNPLGGEQMDGPLLDPRFASFIGVYPIPAVHGMTVGELARLFNDEFRIGARLLVVPMAGWRPGMRWEDTGLAWVRPSPMITSPAAARLHAATGMLEGTSLLVGAGAAVPFETVTAPGVNPERLAGRLNASGLPGVRFVPHRAGSGRRRSAGVRLVVTDPRRFLPATTAVYILAAIRDTHPAALRFDRPTSGRYRFDLVWGTDVVRTGLLRGRSAASLAAAWQEDLRRFAHVRGRYLLYPRAAAAALSPPPQAEVAAGMSAARRQDHRCTHRVAVCAAQAGAAVGP